MPPALIVTETPEFKGHTLACQRFITNTCADAVAAASLGENITDPPKSLGIDDGFKSGASECGKSIVAMAHQMVSGRRAYQGRSSGPQDILVVGPSPSMLSKRRNSKSLPASPISSPPGSPRLMRKNPYFTAPFQEESSGDKHGSSWILSNLFSHRADSQEELSDKESKRFPKPLSSTNLSIKPKPTELREMNFWTPTSM
nr:ACYPI26892 [Acyrthosiphon pisum]